MRSTMMVLLSTALLATSAWAGKKAGVTMPDTVKVGEKQLALNGMGLREATVFKVDVYVAGLYLETVSSDPGRILAANEAKRLVLRFKREVDRDDIVKAWTAGFKGNATVPLATIQPQIDQLNRWMATFAEGDSLTFTFVPGEGVAVDVGNLRKGVIKGDDFARSLFAIWLGPKPPSGDLKKGLLGAH